MAWILRLAAAALVSSVAAGTLMVLFVLSGRVAVPARSWSSVEPPPLDVLIPALGYGLQGSFILAALPALAAGAAMSALGRRRSWARRPRAWAAAGALVGALFWLLFLALAGLLDLEMSSLEAMLGAMFLASGAGAALAFLAVMRLTAPFRP